MSSLSHTTGPTPLQHRSQTTTAHAALAFGGRPALLDRPPVLRPATPTAHFDATVRRLRAADAPAFGAFIQRLSPASRRMRFHGAVNGCSPALLKYLTQTDNPLHQAWLAFDGAACEATVVGEARFVVTSDGADAEFAIVVADDRRGQGIADRLLQTLVDAATRSGVGLLVGDVLEENARMPAFLRRHGFEQVARGADPGAVRWQRRLRAAGRTPGPARPGDGAVSESLFAPSLA